MAFGLLVAILVCTSRAVLNDGDTFTHIAAGGWMLEHLSILRSDPLSSTFAGQPWAAHEWLSEVLLAAAYKAAGLTGIVVLTAAAAAVAISNLARHVGRFAGWRETMLLTAGALLCVVPNILARPHLLALPVLELWVAGVVFARHEGRAPGWWLLLLMVAWANLHGGFAFGIALATALAFEATVMPKQKGAIVWRWWAFVLGSIAAATLTPQVWGGLLFPVRLMRLETLRYIQEWQPVNFTEQFGFECVVLSLVALLGTGRISVPWFRLLLLVGLLHMSISHSRHTLLFGITGTLLLAEPVGRAFAVMCREKSRWGGMALYWPGLALVALLRLAFPVAYMDERVMPVSALAQLSPDVARSRVLNSVQFGGYLELMGIHPFVDGRVELFGDAFSADFRAMSQPGDHRLASRISAYGIEWAILAVDDPLVTNFQRLAGWRQEYADRVAVVFVKG